MEIPNYLVCKKEIYHSLLPLPHHWFFIPLLPVKVLEKEEESNDNNNETTVSEMFPTIIINSLLYFIKCLENTSTEILSVHFNEIKFYYIIHSFLCHEETLCNNDFCNNINSLLSYYINKKCSIDKDISFVYIYNIYL